ncbi:hypothetical protein [Nocardia nova]|nr:hypothetical protein [Nocardia nova]
MEPVSITHPSESESTMPCWLLPFLHHPVQTVPLVFVAPMQEWTFGA